jgi:hypothetical protein
LKDFAIQIRRFGPMLVISGQISTFPEVGNFGLSGIFYDVSAND